MGEIWKKKISSFFEKNAKWRVSRDRSSWIVQGSFKDSRVDIYLLRNIFPSFFHSGIYFPFSKLHSKSTSFPRVLRIFFFRRKTADCQKLRGEIKSTQSFPGFTSRLIHLFRKSSRDLLKISCFVEFHSPESVGCRGSIQKLPSFFVLFRLFFSSFDLSKWIFFALNFFVLLPWNLSRSISSIPIPCIPSNKIEISIFNPDTTMYNKGR